MAGLNDAALNLMATALAAKATHASLHSADPGVVGSSETTAGRQLIAWDLAANGDLSLTGTEAFTGGSASGACTHVGLWAESARVAIASASAATDEITTTGAHGLSVNDGVVFAGSVPTGLSTATLYYVVTVPTGTTFEVSTTPGGSVVDITATGTGTVGRFLGGFPLTGDQTFNASGEYTLNDVTISGSSS